MKKRSFSLLAACLLLLSLLCSCAPAKKAIPTLADCGTVEGMIQHKNAAAFSYTESEGLVSTQNLLFVPGGTVLTCEQKMAVYPYDADLYLDKTLLAQTGQSTVGDYIVIMAAGEITVPQDCYIRVAVEGSLEDVIVAYPEDRKGEVAVFNSDCEAYQKDYDRILSLVNAAPKDAVNYLFITDIHYDGSAISKEQKRSLQKQMEAVVKLAKASDAIDAIVIGGDNTSGAHEEKETAFRYMHELFEPLKSCGKPVLMLMGNHDDNSYANARKEYVQAEADKLISKVAWHNELLKTYVPETAVYDSQNQSSAYYYYDIADKKTRMICLDASDYAQQTDENGTVNALSLAINENGQSEVGISRYGYSARQLQWLISEALTAADDWNYVFLSHMNLGKNVAYGAQLQAVMTAYQNRTSYTDAEIGTADFAKATGTVLVYQYGHVHSERAALIGDTNVWSVATSTANISQLSGNTHGKEGFRAFGTDRECTFDVMSVQEGIVKKYAFGAGEDQELTVNK